MTNIHKKELSLTEDTTAAENHIRAMILSELESHERFRIWVEANYQIHVGVDTENKSIGVKVIEEDMAHAQANLSRLVKARLDEREGAIEVVGASALKNLNNLTK